METVIVQFDNVPMIVPLVGEKKEPLDFPYNDFDVFPSYCGAGQGLGDIIVPEKIFGLKISPACFVHDVMFEISEATWEDFHTSNSVFIHNLLAIVKHRSKNWILEHIRNYRVVTYYNAVDTIGAICFWDTKHAQGLV